MAPSPDPMRFRYVVSSATATAAASDPAPHQEWDALADRVAAPPFLRPGWIAAWCRAYARTAPAGVEVQASTRGLVGALDDFVKLESSGWKKGSGTAIASRTENREFYGEVARWAAERGSLRLSFLALDGRPIAAELALEESGVLYALKGGFDPAYSNFGPGQLVTHESLARSFA